MREFFDSYVRDVFPARRAAARADWAWAGDEWASADLREATFKRIVAALDVDALREIVEFGPGSGKYTEMLLDRACARVVAYELSDAFIDVLNQRCARHVAEGRLDARPIAWTDNEGLLRDYAEKAGTADLVFAIDVFLMMDFQSVLVYLISTARMLRLNGRFFATFADGATESGWARMLRDAGRHAAFDFTPCTRFHWIDRSLLEFVLPRLGFGNLQFEHGPTDGLDIARLSVTAKLVDPAIARSMASSLKPEHTMPANG